ncbi:MAG: hypothetical protein VR72_04780 [Clostridiaceae bacterium BRH_c20a]|nr:MAG: hypothetical protein VR72_04780 [Clostridiaceae bacterium BRH_c20a]
MHLKALWELQVVDRDLERISKEIKQRELVISLKEMQNNISDIETAVEKEQNDIAKLEKSAKKIERDLADLESKRVVQEQKLYEGSCNNPKELESMKVKLDQLREQTSQFEDLVLADMDKLEDKVQLLNRISGQLEDLKKAYYKGVKTYQKNKKQLEDAKESAMKKQGELENLLEENLLKKYQRIQKSFKNAGIARVESGLCSGCRVEIPILHLKNINEGHNIYTCEQCGRILINWDETTL